MMNACLIWLNLKLNKAWLCFLSMMILYLVARLASTVLGGVIYLVNLMERAVYYEDSLAPAEFP